MVYLAVFPDHIIFYLAFAILIQVEEESDVSN
jgi:hypothetical protein